MKQINSKEELMKQIEKDQIELHEELGGKDEYVKLISCYHSFYQSCNPKKRRRLGLKNLNRLYNFKFKNTTKNPMMAYEHYSTSVKKLLEIMPIIPKKVFKKYDDDLKQKLKEEEWILDNFWKIKDEVHSTKYDVEEDEADFFDIEES